MGNSIFFGKFDLKMRNLPNLKREISFFEMGVNQDSRFKVIWKILIVYNMIKKEITDKVNQLCYNLCENKDQMIAFVHFIHFVHSSNH